MTERTPTFGTIDSSALSRRTFLRTGTGALLGTALAGAAGSLSAAPSPAGSAKRLARIGLELYSVRDQMKADPERTLAAVRAIGYQDVELLWSMGNFGRTPAQVRASLDKEGLRAPSAHISPATILDGWEKSLETARLLGHEYLIVPSFSDESTRTLDDWRKWGDHFNRAGEVARRAGIWLAFHNEPNHMKPIDGRVPYDVFVERTDPKVVRLQLDVGNMLMGKGDPFAYFTRHRDRYHSFHLKDVVADGSRDTELGSGTFDFKRFLAMVPDVDRKPAYVEQEGSSDPLESARRDYEYLKKLDF
jgi:sugar phosphate isomerase/epimerase